LKIDSQKEDAMTKKTFNDLLHALQSSMVTAQEALKSRYEASMRRIYEIDNTGAARASALTFAIPCRNRDEEGFENFSLSVLSFLGQHQPRISMFSLEFKCALKRRPLAGGAWTYYLMIKKDKYWGMGQKMLHRMQIVFNGTDMSTGEVSIDGRFFMNIPSQNDQDSSPSETGGKKYLLKRLLNRVMDLLQPEGFMMTVEQAKRAMSILEYEDHEPGEQVEVEADASQKTIF
jgi:hypothetical protein